MSDDTADAAAVNDTVLNDTALNDVAESAFAADDLDPETADAVEADVIERVTIEATGDDLARARAALLEITTDEMIGAAAPAYDEGDGVVSVRFETAMLGYPGWFWTASIAHVEGQEPSVLEVELMPGDGAILSPDWVPWVDRLAEYRATQDAEAAELAALDDDDSDDDESDDDDDSDDDDSDDDDSDDGAPVPVLHGGDLDGVDIDELVDGSDDDESGEDDSDDDESDDDGSDEDASTAVEPDGGARS